MAHIFTGSREGCKGSIANDARSAQNNPNNTLTTYGEECDDDTLYGPTRRQTESD